MAPNGGNGTFWVKLYLKWFILPITYTAVTHTYVESAFYCIYDADKGQVTKWPVALIFRVEEEYVGIEGQ